MEWKHGPEATGLSAVMVHSLVNWCCDCCDRGGMTHGGMESCSQSGGEAMTLGLRSCRLKKEIECCASHSYSGAVWLWGRGFEPRS